MLLKNASKSSQQHFTQTCCVSIISKWIINFLYVQINKKLFTTWNFNTSCININENILFHLRNEIFVFVFDFFPVEFKLEDKLYESLMLFFTFFHIFFYSFLLFLNHIQLFKRSYIFVNVHVRKHKKLHESFKFNT